MAFKQIEFDKELDIGTAIQKALGVYYVRFLRKDTVGDILYKVHNGYIICQELSTKVSSLLT